MHRRGKRQRTKRNHVVDDHRHGIVGDMIIVRLASEVIHRVRHEIFCPKSFLDMGEVALGGLNEVGAFTSACLDFLKLAVVEAAYIMGSFAAGFLGRALERVHGVIVNANTHVSHVLGHEALPVEVELISEATVVKIYTICKALYYQCGLHERFSMDDALLL